MDMITTRLLNLHSSPLHLQPESITQQKCLPASGFISDNDDEDAFIEEEFFLQLSREHPKNNIIHCKQPNNNIERDNSINNRQNSGHHHNRIVRLTPLNNFFKFDPTVENVELQVKVRRMKIA